MHSGRDHEEAVAAFEESRSIAKELFGEGWSHSGTTSDEESLIFMAYSLREVGREGEAEQALARARESLGGNASSFYGLARYDARGARRLAATGGDPGAIKALEHRALEALQRAVTLGFSERLEVRQFGPTFQLHDHPEFRLILLDLDFPAKPFAPGD
jgi:hypothetical protein